VTVAAVTAVSVTAVAVAAAVYKCNEGPGLR
jgi:hypothetical protein